MKKVISFVAALILCVFISVILILFVNVHEKFNSAEYGAWIDEAKFSSYQILNDRMEGNQLLVFGSSEFKHGEKTPYHPENIFKGQKNHLILVGKEYYQSLSHAITLAATAPDLKNKKVALILSPQWFSKGGTDSRTFSDGFSENNYIGMLHNRSVTMKDKKYIRERCETLLEAHKGKKERMLAYDNFYYEDKQGFFEKFMANAYVYYTKGKDKCSVLFKAFINGILKDANTPPSAAGGIDWESYKIEAEKDGVKNTDKNPLNVANSFYQKNIKAKLEDLKACKEGVSFHESPEYADLICFLNICKSNNMEVLLINTPVNGKWYDYAGCSGDRRQVYYERIREIAKDYQVSLVDLSDNEYTKGYFFDTVHLGWKGLFDVNEALYQFQTGS